MKKFLTAICILSACQAAPPVSESPNASSLAADQTPVPTASVDPGPDHINVNVIPGSVSVIYKNSFKVRVNSAQKSITSADAASQAAINELLRTHKVISITDMAFGVSEQEAAAQQALVTEKYGKEYGREVPNRFSSHSYQFPRTANASEVVGKLSALPCVQTAYLTPSAQFGQAGQSGATVDSMAQAD